MLRYFLKSLKSTPIFRQKIKSTFNLKRLLQNNLDKVCVKNRRWGPVQFGTEPDSQKFNLFIHVFK